MKRNINTNWSDYDEGFSLGTSGTDDGAIVRDEEHQSGARMTLEEEGSSAPYTLTCGIYNWMFHTRFFTNEAEAREAFDEMKDDLEEILEAMPSDERAGEEEQEDFAEELAAFIEKYP